MSPSLPPTEITVYNQGFAVVREARRLDLRPGRQSVAVEDVASGIDPSSVSIRSLTAPEAFHVLEQNYGYDLVGPAAILAKAVGERLRVDDEGRMVEGVLISSPGQNGGGLVLRTDDGRVVLHPKGQITLERVPDGLLTRPTLRWEIETDREGGQDVELSYVTEGLSWSADYVLTLDGEGRASLQAWVTLDNGSGATYRNARLKLLAGDVNRTPEPTRLMALADAEMGPAAAMSAFEEEALFEYHLYTLGRPTTLADREKKQISLFDADAVPVRKRIVVDGSRLSGWRMPQEGDHGAGDLSPQVRLEFANDAASNLGLPLPEGRVRMYGRDAGGSVQLMGEDRIDHTPRDERISLVAGRAFDVRAGRRRDAFERLGSRGARERFEIELRNRKDVPETVEVVERLWGAWRVVDATDEFTKRDANTITFDVPLAAGETRTVGYTVETCW